MFRRFVNRITSFIQFALLSFRPLLRWAKVEDGHDRSVSLTNLAFMLGLYKLATLQDFTLTEVTAFLALVIAYVAKTTRGARHAVKEERIAALEAAAEAHAGKVAELAEGVEAVTKKTAALVNKTAGLGTAR